MEKTLTKKLDKIESLLIQLNKKIDNFLGIEEISKKEIKDIGKIRLEIDNGEFETFQEVFKE